MHIEPVEIHMRLRLIATMIKASETFIKFTKGGANKDITMETDGCSWDAEYTN